MANKARIIKLNDRDAGKIVEIIACNEQGCWVDFGGKRSPRYFLHNELQEQV